MYHNSLKQVLDTISSFKFFLIIKTVVINILTATSWHKALIMFLERLLDIELLTGRFGTSLFLVSLHYLYKILYILTLQVTFLGSPSISSFLPTLDIFFKYIFSLLFNSVHGILLGTLFRSTLYIILPMHSFR